MNLLTEWIWRITCKLLSRLIELHSWLIKFWFLDHFQVYLILIKDQKSINLAPDFTTFKSNNILSFRTALQIQYRCSSCNPRPFWWKKHHTLFKYSLDAKNYKIHVLDCKNFICTVSAQAGFSWNEI